MLKSIKFMLLLFSLTTATHLGPGETKSITQSDVVTVNRSV